MISMNFTIKELDLILYALRSAAFKDDLKGIRERIGALREQIVSKYQEHAAYGGQDKSKQKCTTVS